MAIRSPNMGDNERAIEDMRQNERERQLMKLPAKLKESATTADCVAKINELIDFMQKSKGGN